MDTLSTLTLAGSLLLTANVHAIEVSGVQIPETITLSQQDFQLNGAGVRSKFFIDLYIGSLYLTTRNSDAVSIIDAEKSVIRLNITSGMITADKMRDAIREGFDDATEGDMTLIQPEINIFMALFNEEIKESDQFTLFTSKTSGVTAYKNGTAQATIKGENFRQALLKIWLGDEPAQNSLKRSMLGQ
ncbi:chalcone isomerase family protein [Shewanella sp. VB17]|uniref:chalcone isomerase family protein n=1 Tax=Shewanella sp. VB17 TaxID=2739432 RepID=UPI001564ACF5|nr:chalcone isomerase family protein [Shewanella sp. VB17]NRD73407.1 chalcone isomerase family protein [Shewanella sp. VB17]